jgi:hypothetical protein
MTLIEGALEDEAERLQALAALTGVFDLEEKFQAPFVNLVTLINTSDEVKRAMRLEGHVHLVVVKTGLYLTPLGVDFAHICIPD